MLICFVENFSWEDVKDHMLGELRAWTFTDWETPFAALVNNEIVGTTYIRKKDYYPLPAYIPSIHTGLYEKYGYRYLRDIVNYGGGTDRLYVKEI